MKLPGRPMASSLSYLKTVATKIRRYLEVKVGESWAALASEEDHQGREIRTLLVEAGAEERETRRRGESCPRGGRVGSHGTGVACHGF